MLQCNINIALCTGYSTCVFSPMNDHILSNTAIQFFLLQMDVLCHLVFSQQLCGVTMNGQCSQWRRWLSTIYTHTHTYRNQWLTYMESTKFTAHVCKWLYHLDSGTISQFQGRIVFILIHLSCLVCKVNGPCNFFAMFKHITLSLRFYSAQAEDQFC